MFSEEILGCIFLKEVNREITQIRNGQKKKSRNWIPGNSKDFPLQHHVQTACLAHSA